MKKLATLILTAGLVFAGVTGASAVDFKAKGQFIMSFDLGKGANGDAYGFNGADSFEATQRVRLQLEAVASESLSGTVFFEMGNTVWGNSGSGGALGTDGRIVEVKHAYLDWIVPNTELKVRMGLQALGLPSYATGSSQVFVHDVAGIVLNNKFNDNVSLTAFWARPFNDNYLREEEVNGVKVADAYNDNDNFLDNVDMIGLVLPMTFDNVKIAPWVMYTAVGRNFIADSDNVQNGNNVVMDASNYTVAYDRGLLRDGTSSLPLDPYGSIWHAGLTGSVNFNNPFTLAWDINYGSADYGISALNRSGFYLTLLAEYKMDWGTPGLYAWYSSGDDGDISDGSERMPVINTTGGTHGYSNFAFDGALYIEREGVIGTTSIGTWGIGARVKDFSFMEDLKHTFRINYIAGTNHGENGRWMRRAHGKAAWATGTGNAESIYMTTEDWALEFGLVSTYKIYENLTLSVDANYLILDMDDDIWGNYNVHDAWNINTSFVYSF